MTVRQVPGGGYAQEETTAQRQLPGPGCINEQGAAPPPPAAAGGPLIGGKLVRGTLITGTLVRHHA